MKLIFGGAYQGKLDIAKEKYNVRDEDVFYCTESSKIRSDFKVIYGLEKFALGCVKEGLNPVEEIKKYDFNDSILIVTDISCGTVPVDKTERLGREANGRMITALASEADSVERVFCGLSWVLKGEAT